MVVVSATASLGVIHRGHEREALSLMSTYLPKDSGPGSAYAEGGGLYALGLIHANHGADIMEYLLNQLKEASTDMVRHGACLGLGESLFSQQPFLRQDFHLTAWKLTHAHTHNLTHTHTHTHTITHTITHTDTHKHRPHRARAHTHTHTHTQ